MSILCISLGSRAWGYLVLHLCLLTCSDWGRELHQIKCGELGMIMKSNWTVSPVILETDASLMLVIQCLSAHKLLNKCAAGKL